MRSIREGRAAVDAAVLDLVDVVERIEREAKRAASVLYPRAAALEEIRGSLRAGEALVLYGLFQTDAIALVVPAGGAR